MSWRERRYSPWLLKHEDSLRRRRESFRRAVCLLAVLIALIEATLPWDRLTPLVPAWVHILVAALVLPLLYLLWQADAKRKEQAFALALSDRGRRLLFLDPYLEPEEFALSESYSGAHVLPLQRQIDNAIGAGPGASLHRRMEQYYRTLPSATHEGDRLGLLSFLHAGTFFTWLLMLALVWAAAPGFGVHLPGGQQGLTALPLLGPLYLYAARVNTRFGYESALYDWLRMG